MDLAHRTAISERVHLPFALNGRIRGAAQQWFADGIKQRMLGAGHSCSEEPDAGTGLVFNFTSASQPRPFRRRGSGTFVVSVVETESRPVDMLREGYPILIRSLANLLVVLTPGAAAYATHFVTLEQGAYSVAEGDRQFDDIYARIAPLASSRLVIDNDFHPDLPADLWQGDAITEQIRQAGVKLDGLNLLPAPFPIRELLPARDFDHVKRLYGIGGLSYGNLSARQAGNHFWMSASGVNKADLTRIGQDILLVKGYDAVKNAMVLSVPPHIKPRRVSVDAIEHWMVYTEHPAVGAIVHIHAWMDGIASTQINYPCGTYELAAAVATLVRQAPDPSRAVIGLKNHGLTITGRDMHDIFERIEGRIIPQVPMS